MNKKLMIAGVAAAVVVAAGGAMYYLMPRDEMTLAHRALQGSGSATCTYTDADSGDEGTLYIRSGDMRVVADAQTHEGEAATAHFLIKGDTGYMWADDEPQGVQFAMEEPDMAEASVEVDWRDMDEEEFTQEYERNQFSCGRGADRAMFDVPGDIEFMDMSDFASDAFMQETGSQPEMPEQPEMPSSDMSEEEIERAIQEFEQQEF